MLRDYRGCRVTGATPAALERFEQALAELQRHRGDPCAAVRQAVEEAPGFVAARQLEIYLHLCSRDPAVFFGAFSRFDELVALEGEAREALHTEAIRAVLEGDYERAGMLHDAIVAEEPRDLMALSVAHAFDHILGNTGRLKSRMAGALPAWSPELPGYAGMLAMQAFGLEEAGEYRAAEEAAQRALEIDPASIRAHHAMVHVLEMEGRAEDGVRWMSSRLPHWIGGGPASVHNWWHFALFHLERGEVDRALGIHDRFLYVAGLSAMIDAANLLWRLHLQGEAQPQRFRALAERWAPHAEDAHCAFNDVHAMAAFAGAGRWDCAHALLAAQIRAAAKAGTPNADMTRLVGLPACRAILAYAQGDFGTAEALLRGLPAVAHRLGGSHAQRDLLALTHAAAARAAWRRAA